MESSELPQIKTEKQLEKEAKKNAKLQKLQNKLEKKSDDASKPKIKVIQKVPKEVKEIVKYTFDTPPGEKKNTSEPIPDAYSPQYVEAAWYSWWESQGFFKPEYGRESILSKNDKGKFAMVMPPPNVTGSLHLGHALTNAIEDAITRWNRMKGITTIWVPGCDHAGIATQVVVEKKLWREKQLTRHDLGREQFVENIWKWKNEKGDRIYHQLKKIGSSCDWSRTCFTMDPKLCRSVNEAFVRLYDKGYIYRNSRLVNWSCALRSAISDIEVDKVELLGRTLLSIPGYTEKVEFGVLVLFGYQIENSDEQIIVATTRVETMLGDCAIAVHPKDERYIHLHGKFAVHPFTPRRIPILCDEFVETEFGTGAVKITPAHDPNDYEIGKKYNLPFITIFNDSGVVIGDYGEFTGMKRFNARVSILTALKEKNLYKETKDNPMVVPICSRSKDVVEPLIKPQWYVKCDEMAQSAKEAVKTGELKIIPENHIKTWYHWMDGIRDWCISRQLWWGHRIPAYLVEFKNIDNLKESLKDEEPWIVGRTYEEALEKASVQFGVNKSEITLKQDEDVLDTWFSSALFPFSVFGWPENTTELDVFYPTTLLETGSDIIFFWVARMVFFGQTLVGKLPFKEVFLHSMVRDAHGRKMSKSLGNVIDPMDVIMGISLEDLHNQLYNSNLDYKEIEKAKAAQTHDYPNGIPECGTDAMRFALCSYTTQGRDINLDILRVQGYRFFCNKIWNATKFALMYFTGNEKFCSTTSLTGNESKIDLWILSRLSWTIDLCNTGFESFEFATATTACYNFWLYELCDVYLECIKPVFQSGPEDTKQSARQTLYTCLELGLTLISPFMPFISEELFQRIPRANLSIASICVSPYPETSNTAWRNVAIEKEVDLMQRIAKTIRSARSDYNVPNKLKTEAYVISTDMDLLKSLEGLTQYLSVLSFCSNIYINQKPPIGCAILTISGTCEINLLLKGLIDVEKEISKLQKKRDSLHITVQKLNQVINDTGYAKNVPDGVKSNNSDKLKESEREIERITSAIATLQIM